MHCLRDDEPETATNRKSVNLRFGTKRKFSHSPRSSIFQPLGSSTNRMRGVRNFSFSFHSSSLFFSTFLIVAKLFNMILVHSKGVYDDEVCSSDMVNHAMLIVGYTPTEWILKNWWGDGWGENGYMRLAKNKNRCGIANYAAYAKV